VNAFLKQHNLPDDQTVNIVLRLLKWDDGGRVFGLRNGLSSALKAVDIEFLMNDMRIPIPSYWYAFIVNRSWTTSVSKVPETKINVNRLHDETMQWASVEQEGSIQYGDLKLTAFMMGPTCDTAIRNKALGKDSRENRCGWKHTFC